MFMILFIIWCWRWCWMFYMLLLLVLQVVWCVECSWCHGFWCWSWCCMFLMLLLLVLKATHWMFLILLLLLLNASGVISEWSRQWEDSFEEGGGGSTGNWGKIQYCGRKILATPSGSFSQEMPPSPHPPRLRDVKKTRILARSSFWQMSKRHCWNNKLKFFLPFFSFRCRTEQN